MNNFAKIETPQYSTLKHFNLKCANKDDKEGLLIYAENHYVNILLDTDIRMVLVCYQQIQFNFAYKKEKKFV